MKPFDHIKKYNALKLYPPPSPSLGLDPIQVDQDAARDGVKNDVDEQSIG